MAADSKAARCHMPLDWPASSNSGGYSMAYIVEYFIPYYRPEHAWRVSGYFPTLAAANERARQLRHAFAEGGCKTNDSDVRVRRA